LGFAACVAKTEATKPRICTPGNYVFCRCKDRSEGTKLCSEDGTAFAPCEDCLSGSPDNEIGESEPDAEPPDTGPPDSGTLDAGRTFHEASCRDGCPDGWRVGCREGRLDGERVGCPVGLDVGCDEESDEHFHLYSAALRELLHLDINCNFQFHYHLLSVNGGVNCGALLG
jgi:hypothetical protein